MLERICLSSMCVLLSGFQMACAPSNAKAVREDRSVTLGLIGASYRPVGNVGVVIGAELPLEYKEPMPHTEVAGSVVKLADEEQAQSVNDRKVTIRSNAFSGSVVYYPWDTSAFFVGLGGRVQNSHYQFDEKTNGYDPYNPDYSEIDVRARDTYVSVPLGWAWIWGNGFSFTFDFGPRVFASQDLSYKEDGNGSNVDTGERDRSIEGFGKKLVIGGSGLLGWSF